MEKLKRLIAITLAFATLIFSTGVPVNAEVNGDMSINEGGQPYIPNETDIILNQKKLSEMNVNNKMGLMAAPSGYKKSLSMTCFEQINGYYCGPATVKQTIHYMLGDSLTQEGYAKQLGTTTAGTDMTLITGVLNKNIGYYKYSYIDIGTFSNWCDKVYSSVKADRPVVIDIKATSGSGWPYTTNGHFLNVAGYDSTGSTTKAMVTDPYIKGLGNNWYNAQTIYNVNNAHFRKAMIW